MNEKGIAHTTDIRVRYAETDGMRVVYHGNYLVYFEQARTEMLRSIGLPYAKIEEMGIFVIVIEAHANYRRSALYDDLLHVKAMVREMPTNRIKIEYEIRRNNESELIVDGYTLHTFLNSLSNRPAKPPKEFTELMQKYF
ncbi:MAG: acyl-CoA thioesterase [Ignavibacteriales bacterium]|nr:acyl-CoA thioesterase [Ignavibacteriales bacterium]